MTRCLRVSRDCRYGYHRAYGRSQFFNFPRIYRTATDVAKLWFALVIRRAHRHPELKGAADAVGQGTRAS